MRSSMELVRTQGLQDSMFRAVSENGTEESAVGDPLLHVGAASKENAVQTAASAENQPLKPRLAHPTSLPGLIARSWERPYMLGHRRNRSVELARGALSLLNAEQSEWSNRKFSDGAVFVNSRDFYQQTMQERRKLSESRGVKLPIINITSPSLRSSHSQSVKSNGLSDEKNFPKQVKYADQQDASTSQFSSPPQGSPPLTSSPVGYTLRHARDLMVDTSARAAPKLDTPPHMRLSDVIDITIFLADQRGFKFSLVGGKVASAASLLMLMADHLDIDEAVMEETCSLWMVSDLLEVQLKPHHVPCEVRRSWIHLLKKFTCAEKEEMEADEPLLMLKRNVLLDVYRERELDDEHERLTEILYECAKEEVLCGRYVCNLEMSIRLAALQMAIEMGPYDSDEHTPDVISEDLHLYFPVQHRHTVKTVYLFGIPVIGCKGLEGDIVEEFRTVSAKYDSNHAKRVAYLEIVRPLPFYGAAFFRGQVERPPAGSFKEIKKMLLAATMPDIQVLVGVNREYCTVIDPAKHELLLCQSLFDCSWRRVDIDKPHEEVTSSTKLIGLPCFLLHFPDETERGDRSANLANETMEMPERSKLLQVFSRQAVMMEALMTALYHVTLLEAKQLEDFDEAAEEFLENEEEVEMGAEVEPASVDTFGQRSSNSSDDSAASKSNNNGHVSSSSQNYGDKSSRRRRVTPSSSMDEVERDPSPQSPAARHSCRVGSPCQFANNLSKLCLATFDAAGRCVEAQGSLRRVLQEVS